MILVTGAAGKTGLAVIRALSKRGATTRALVRRLEQEALVRSAGATEVFGGDLLDAHDLAQAMAGVEAMYLIAPNVHPQEYEIAKNAIAAAKAAGVRLIVCHSVLFPQIEAMPHHWQKLRAEEELIQSGMDFVILQPASYMQNVLPYWGAIFTAGEYTIPYSVDAPFTPVDLEDVAEVAAEVLLGKGMAGGVFPLAGPERMTTTGMAEQMTRVLERPVRAVAQPLETWKAQAKASGMAAYGIDALGKMFAYYDKHGLAGNSSTLESLLRRPPTTFAAFLHRTISGK